ncbi:MAG: nucleotide exchange factor GrpE [Nitrospiria bacterium]
MPDRDEMKEEPLETNKKDSPEEGLEKSEVAEDAPSEEVVNIELQLREEIKKNEKAAKDAHDRYLRTLADFENYKKRTQKDQADRAKYANEQVFKEILPVVDNLDRAITHSNERHDFEKMLEGVVLIQKQVLSVLEKFGVRPIECLNEAFDPFRHESVGQVELDENSDVEENHIVEEAQKGYFLKDRVLRPSFVMIGKKKARFSPKKEKSVAPENDEKEKDRESIKSDAKKASETSS